MIGFKIFQHLPAAHGETRMIAELMFEPSVEIDTPFHGLPPVLYFILYAIFRFPEFTGLHQVRQYRENRLEWFDAYSQCILDHKARNQSEDRSCIPENP